MATRRLVGRKSRSWALLALVAGGVLVAAVKLPSAEAQHGMAVANPWTGTWKMNTPNWGESMVLAQAGGSVTGTYDFCDGRVKGTVSGNQLKATWTQTWPCGTALEGSGVLEVTMSADGNSFSGHWRYATKGGWRENDPVGTRVGAIEDKQPPTVGAVAKPGVFRPGQSITLEFTVKDDSGQAKVAIALYDGGGRGRGAVLGPLKADGTTQSWTTSLSPSLSGPLYFCVWAQDAAGHRSGGAPKSDCEWLKLLVPIAKVSNGCGGSGWPTIVAAQNYIGNTSVYKDSNFNPAAKSYRVNFVEACNLHDAGYGGQMVEDSIRGGRIDYRNWPRAAVDKKFWDDMRILCQRQIKGAPTALKNCLGRGGHFSLGAQSRYNFVREWGNRFFDADVAVEGTQRGTAHEGKPWGGVRPNN